MFSWLGAVLGDASGDDSVAMGEGRQVPVISSEYKISFWGLLWASDSLYIACAGTEGWHGRVYGQFKTLLLINFHFYEDVILPKILRVHENVQAAVQEMQHVFFWCRRCGTIVNMLIPTMGGYLTSTYGFKLFLQSNILNVDHHHSPWLIEGDRCGCASGSARIP